MKSSRYTPFIWWFSVPFCLVFALISILRLQSGPSSKVEFSVPDTAQLLLGQEIPAQSLIDVGLNASKDPGFVLPDIAWVLLLGGVSCSGN